MRKFCSMGVVAEIGHEVGDEGVAELRAEPDRQRIEICLPGSAAAPPDTAKTSTVAASAAPKFRAARQPR
jgi:hypothetical protein